MKDDMSNGNDVRLTENFANSARRIVTVDIERYQVYLDGMDVSQERKEEFLRAMFSIMLTFVDLGFEIHPLQEVCGKDGIGTDQRPKLAFDEVRSGEIQKIETRNRTDPEGRLEAE